MKRHSHLWITLVVAAGLALTFWGCDELFSYEYKIVGSWQIAHTYLNEEEIDSTDYVGYAPTTFYYMYADHVMSLTGVHNGEIRQSSFATYIVDQKAKTVSFDYTFFGKRYQFVADIKKLARKEFIIEFNDENGDHWRLEMFSRSNY